MLLHHALFSAVAFGLLSIASASPKAVLNTQTPPAPGVRKAVHFSFGGKDNQDFMLNGNPFQIRGGEMHPQRIPREYWRHRIRAAKAMGLNTIAFYVFWNDLEQSDGSFDFKTGNRDIGAFMTICQEEGMWVLFRPGPYVCGEWDLGGLPAYLLKKQNARLRTTKDKDFMRSQTRYLEAVAREAEPYLCKNGGPILMTQIENEYGSYDGAVEKEYVQWLLDWWKKKGFGPFYTSDGASEAHLRFSLPGVAVGLDPGVKAGDWEVANKVNPGVPVFSSETYPGWLRHWGEGNWAPTHETVNTVKWYMDKGLSFSLYVVHGGSSFGFTAGANSNGDYYQPDLTSYDYGSPIGENGNLTEDYFKMRNHIQAKLPPEVKLPEPPAPIETMEIPEWTPAVYAGLWENIPAPAVKRAPEPPWFEALGQNQGMAIYRSVLPPGPEEELQFTFLHDYAMVYLDGQLAGKLDRRNKEKSLKIPARKKNVKLDVLVDTMGHINFCIGMERDRKGIYGPVTLGDKKIGNWTVHPVPLHATSIVKAAPGKNLPTTQLGAHFRSLITLDEPKDTFLDMSKYVRGYVWVNGHCLGRYWNIGPQLRLYCPATFLKQGKNVVDVIDIELTEPRPLRGMKDRNREQGKVETKNLNNDW